jgi:hypothetical protein
MFPIPVETGFPLLYKGDVPKRIGSERKGAHMARGQSVWTAGLTWAAAAMILAAVVLGPGEALSAKRAGAYWASLSREQKTDLVLGIFEGFNLNENILSITLKNEYTICSDIMESIMRQSDAFFEDMPAGNIVTGLDAFYSDKKNKNIPVSWGLWVVVRKNRRDPTLGDFLGELRNLYP